MKDKPMLHHNWTIQEMWEKLHLKESDEADRHWESVEWYHDVVEDMRMTIRELLQYCNNADVAEKAWKLLDMVEVGE